MLYQIVQSAISYPQPALCRKLFVVPWEQRHSAAFPLITKHHHHSPELLNVTAKQKESLPSPLFLLEKDTMIYHERISEQRAATNAVIRYWF